MKRTLALVLPVFFIVKQLLCMDRINEKEKRVGLLEEKQANYGILLRADLTANRRLFHPLWIH